MLGYAKMKYVGEAVGLFREMMEAGFEPDDMILVMEVGFELDEMMETEFMADLCLGGVWRAGGFETRHLGGSVGDGE